MRNIPADPFLRACYGGADAQQCVPDAPTTTTLSAALSQSSAPTSFPPPPTTSATLSNGCDGLLPLPLVLVSVSVVPVACMMHHPSETHGSKPQVASYRVA